MAVAGISKTGPEVFAGRASFLSAVQAAAPGATVTVPASSAMSLDEAKQVIRQALASNPDFPGMANIFGGTDGADIVAPLFAISILKSEWGRLGKGGIDLLDKFFAASAPGAAIGAGTNACKALAGTNANGVSGRLLQACLRLVCSSPVLYARLDGADRGLNLDDIIGPAGLKSVLDRDIESVNGARTFENADHYATWAKANPDAPQSAKALARSLGLLAAFSDFFQRPHQVNGYLQLPEKAADTTNRISIDMLKMAANDTALPQPLREAAAFWSKAGTFTALDLCGENAATHEYDGLTAEQNIKAFFEDVMPETDAEVAAFLATTARMEATTPYRSAISPALYGEGGLAGASAAVKAAAYIDLQNYKTRLAAGAPIIGQDRADRVEAQVDERLARLAADQPTQDWLAANEAAGVQALLGANGGLRSAIQGTLFTPTFRDTIIAKLRNLSAEGAGEVAGLLELYRVTTGKDYRLDTSGPVLAALEQLRTMYAGLFVSGAYLNGRLAAGVPTEQALIEFTSVKQALEWALSFSPWPVTADQAAATLDAVTSTLRAEIGNVEKDAAHWRDALAIVGLAPDATDEEICEKVGKYLQAHPQVLVAARESAPEDGSGPTPDDVLRTMVAMMSLVRAGFKLDDAIKQVSAGEGHKLYRTGALHIAGALLLGFVTAARSNVSAPAYVLASMQIAGWLMEGAAKALQDDLKLRKPITPKQQFDDLMTKFKLFESAAKFVGGFVGVVGGALSLYASIVAFKRGDALGGAMNLVGFVGQHTSSSALIADAAINVGIATKRILKEVVIKVLARLAGVAYGGAVLSAVSALAMAAQFIIEAILAAINRHKVGVNVLDVLRDRHAIDTR